ncbi:M48 family metallopeptidase [Luteimonas lutimaris]|uniref:SprT family zinc-dependent metalloprotease n=1 Tax=Luteimonas lutimaris TaxID=698645 RepID=A0ABP7M777_9GAMM|nr:SprT family zinc-dependent metalloprotease [Luteimonas sp.]
MPPLSRLLTPKPKPRTLERDSFDFTLGDGRSIRINRVRDPRARRLRLSVDERGARLTLPPRASLVSGERFVREHGDWLAQQLAVHDGDDGIAPLQRGVTASLPLRGRMLPLSWHEGRFTALQFDGETLAMQAPARAGQAALVRALRDFYEAQARADLGRWLPRHLPTLPRAPSRIRLKVMSSQWGSLAPDDAMSLDLSLVLGTPDAFEYVLVHELCHLLHRDHSPAFWREVGARFPGWPAQRDYFHAEGRRLKAGLRRLLAC